MLHPVHETCEVRDVSWMQDHNRGSQVNFWLSDTLIGPIGQLPAPHSGITTLCASLLTIARLA